MATPGIAAKLIKKTVFRAYFQKKHPEILRWNGDRKELPIFLPTSNLANFAPMPTSPDN